MTDTKKRDGSDSLYELVRKRDSLIRQICCVYIDISKLVDADDIKEEDYDLWGKATSHSTVQNALSND